MIRRNPVYMATGTCLVLSIALACAVRPAHAQLNEDSLYALAAQGRYFDAAKGFYEYRTRYNVKRASLDCLIAACLCRDGDARNRQVGRLMLEDVLRRHQLSAETYREVMRERDACGAGPTVAGAGPLPSVIVSTALVSGAGIAANLKQFYWLDRENAIVSEPTSILRVVPDDSLKMRLFSPSEVDPAVASLQGRMGLPFVVEAVGGFVLASLSGHSRAELERIGEALNAYARFFEEAYGFEPLPHLVTVYLVPGTGDLYRLAGTLHGLSISRNAIGYSWQDDLSIGAVVPSMTYGSLMHELVHLLVRANLGDASPWLHEGLASLYESSRLEEGRIVGVTNWRGRVLEEFWSERPTLADLVRMDWRTFNQEPGAFGTEGGPDEMAATIRQAAYHATARYFMLFLQEEGMLGDVFDAYYMRDAEVYSVLGGVIFGTDRTGEVLSSLDDDVALLERVLGEGIESTQQRFDEWLGANLE